MRNSSDMKKYNGKGANGGQGQGQGQGQGGANSPDRKQISHVNQTGTFNITRMYDGKE